MKKIMQLFPFILLAAVAFWQQWDVRPEFRVYLVGMIVAGYVYFAEEAFQKQRMQQWDVIRTRGKREFILKEYVLYRGGAVSVLLVMLLSFKVSIGPIILISVLPLLGVMALAGSVVWHQCEREFQERIYRTTTDMFTVQQN